MSTKASKCDVTSCNLKHEPQYIVVFWQRFFAESVAPSSIQVQEFANRNLCEACAVASWVDHLTGKRTKLQTSCLFQ